jgi:hypothetical protein
LDLLETVLKEGEPKPKLSLMPTYNSPSHKETIDKAIAAIRADEAALEK